MKFLELWRMVDEAVCNQYVPAEARKLAIKVACSGETPAHVRLFSAIVRWAEGDGKACSLAILESLTLFNQQEREKLSKPS